MMWNEKEAFEIGLELGRLRIEVEDLRNEKAEFLSRILGCSGTLGYPDTQQLLDELAVLPTLTFF